MPPLPKALLILALLSTILVVSAAPATGGKVASKGSSLKTHDVLFHSKEILQEN
ncbi:hypothetical protein NECAME_01646 [Necator americanus]|uniref:Uncharacterized protein n=1 Tax=Necator americanus TaxID=51031 RepID=W2TQU1_NECAM|nr:hypothetical protein NECAME_01646 [Necator americanus]ETN84420.1 hypothetical protein NECAME_01646 [Necator americanus]